MPELDERLATNWKFMKGNKAVPRYVCVPFEFILSALSFPFAQRSSILHFARVPF